MLGLDSLDQAFALTDLARALLVSSGLLQQRDLVTVALYEPLRFLDLKRQCGRIAVAIPKQGLVATLDELGLRLASPIAACAASGLFVALRGATITRPPS
jgi:hypothetical protein